MVSGERKMFLHRKWIYSQSMGYSVSGTDLNSLWNFSVRDLLNPEGLYKTQPAEEIRCVFDDI